MNDTAVLISIKPKWVNLILSGKKTIEIRKTIPKLTPPFTCYIYESGTGCVVGEFLCDKIDFGYEWQGDFVSYISGLHTPDFYGKSQIDPYLLRKYVGYGSFFTWGISSVKEYDTPILLSAFKVACKQKKPCNECQLWNNGRYQIPGCALVNIEKPPQSWRYVQKRVEA